ncbi:MAG: hypothetical protein A2Y12_13110 [Planctomycetes bacterium GWF2_42_9]|nr:MAG: hypothetical protein A2Y12_13110 [Planctomycetes bacterium GWF2_42_9]
MRESFLKLFKGGNADEIVWTADIFYWMAGKKVAGQVNSEWENEVGYLQFCKELGIMPYYWYKKFWLGVPRYTAIDFIESKSVLGSKRYVWKTAVGELWGETVFLKESCSEACAKYPVENEDDLKTLLYILEHRQMIPDCIEDYHERFELWVAYGGIPCIAMPRSPLSCFFYEWTGLQNGIYMLMDYPGLVGEILNLMEEQEIPILNAVCKLSPPLVHFADNLSSENFSSLFESFMAEPYKRRLSRLHNAGIKCAVHLDGTTRGLLPRLAELGIDAIEALTPYPSGDITSVEMRELINDTNAILWGGVPGAMFSEPFTWKHMKKHVEDLVQNWHGTRFIIAVADQVPANGNIKLVKKVSELLKSLMT